MTFSEIEFLGRMNYRVNKPILIDVGANRGQESEYFAKKNWVIHAFEPEKSSYSILCNKLSEYSNTFTYPYAISDNENLHSDFYISDKHFGIHALKPFHPSHRKSYQVKTIRLDKFFNKNNIKYVSLLKIDIEGADFLALKSNDFHKIKPDIVMIEFMDKRTVRHYGYSHRDVINYMTKLGYIPYISIWDEIKEYATDQDNSPSHRWVGCKKYSNKIRIGDTQWGNLIFFKKSKFNSFTIYISLNIFIIEWFIKQTILKTVVKSVRIIKNILRHFYSIIFKNSFLYYLFRLYKSVVYIIDQLNFIKSQNSYNMEQYKNKYNGKRCFILGNGPSLKNTNLKLLKHEITFGLNRIYLNFKNMGYKTSFLVSVNKLLIEQCHKDINLLEMPKFISEKTKKYFSQNNQTMFLKSLNTPGFYPDITSGIWEGSTVTCVALQIAYFMGFSEVILVGIDHNFVTKGEPHKTVIQNTDDPNHFSSEYFKGMKWQLPDLVTSEAAYRLAKYVYEQSGRKIYDATVGGKLKIFTKKNLESFFYV